MPSITPGQVVGQYLYDDSATHGFVRASDGTLTYPIDPPGAVRTFVFGVNDAGLIVGRYIEAATGMSHAFLLQLPDQFFTYDYPGATFTSFNGINRGGFICGRYRSADGIEHGLVVRARPAAGQRSVTAEGSFE